MEPEKMERWRGLLNTIAAPALFLIVSFAGHAAAAGISVEVIDAKGAPVENAVLSFYPVSGKAPPSSVKTVIIDQVDKEFLPEVTVVPLGTPVFFPNSDSIRHQLYSLSKTKSFEIPLYSGTPSNPIVFDKPGVVTLGCNIHDWMLAYIYVADTPYYVKTDSGGKARMEGLGEEQYTVTVWHPRMKTAVKDTAKTVHANGGGTVRMELALKPDWRIRRAPVIGGGGY